MHASTLLNGQVAIVTGGGGGIGRAIALACAEAGADVAIGDIIAERGGETAASVRELGRRAPAVPPHVLATGQLHALATGRWSCGDRVGRSVTLPGDAEALK